MTNAEHSPFRADRKLKINIAAALVLIVLCPLALWYFYFRHDHKTARPLTGMVNNFCKAYSKPTFHAQEVFAGQVNYFGTAGSTPVDIDKTVALERQTHLYPKMEMIQGTLSDSAETETGTSVNAWLRETEYVKSAQQYRTVELQFHFEFDKEGKISLIDTLSSRNESFSRSMPQ